MANLDMGLQRPEEENSQEKEQAPEQILEVIREAIEKGEEVLIVQLTADGEVEKDIVLPISIEGNHLMVKANGYGFNIEIDGIKRAE